MRRLILCLVVAGAIAALAASVAPAKSGLGTMCVLHAKMTAKNETTGSTSAAKGRTLIKVRNDGTIEFKTQVNNRKRETFIAGHIHQAPVGVAGPIVVPLFVAPAPPTSARHIKQSGMAPPTGTTGADLCHNTAAFYVNYHTTAFPGGAIRGQLRRAPVRLSTPPTSIPPTPPYANLEVGAADHTTAAPLSLPLRSAAILALDARREAVRL